MNTDLCEGIPPDILEKEVEKWVKIREEELFKSPNEFLLHIARVMREHLLNPYSVRERMVAEFLTVCIEGLIKKLEKDEETKF
jgi:hypothetical protein